MAVQVEHDKRKHEILAKALDLFIEEGYEDVTFQKIADRCGITRTTLYIYFKNKREIFLWSIKQLLGELEQKLRSIISDKSLSATDCLRSFFYTMIDACEQNTQLFKVLLVYLIQLQKSQEDVDRRVQRRLVRLQHLMSTVVIRGQQSGELLPLPVKDIDTLLYTVMEGAVLHLAVLGKKNLDDIRQVVSFSIATFSAKREGLSA